jgi:ABC-type sulfate transport system substrate-binding protein
MEGKAMKRILTLMVAMVLFLFVPLGCAQNENSTSSEETKELLETLMKTVDMFCELESRFATNVMTGRQIGAPMSAFFEDISNVEGLENKENLKGIVAEAYATPRFSTEKSRKEAIEDFTNEIYLRCYTAKREEILEALRSSK